MCREAGSSVSSQCRSTRSPRRAAISQRMRTDSAPSAIVRSKCGMPPTMSTPLSSARVRLPSAPSERSRPSCGNATSCRSRYGRTRSRTCSSASTASSRGSQTSTCERIASRPLPTAQSQYASARSTRASIVSKGFSSFHKAMPSSSVPDALTRGSPYDSVASMWKCASTNGGVTSCPCASSSRRAAATAASSACGATAAIRPSRTAMSIAARPSGSAALRTTRSYCTEAEGVVFIAHLCDRVSSAPADRRRGAP